jgi:agmatine/peptidylarginine deiminase
MHWKSNAVIVHCPKDGLFYSHDENKEKNHQLYEKLTSALFQDGTEAMTIVDEMPSIWVRDYFPINVDGKFKLFKPCTDYMDMYQREFYDNYDFNQLAMFVSNKVKKVDLILDGGNAIFNDKLLFTTEKVYKDNYNKSKREVNKILQESFNGRKVIVLKTEDSKYDPVGHSDGLVNFLDNDTLFVSDYRKIDKELHHHNRRQIGDLVESVILPQYFVDKVTSIDEENEWYDIEGCYVNFIGTKTSLIFPKFKRKEYNDQIKEIVTKHDKLKRKLHFINSSAVTKYGGGLHCITYDFFKPSSVEK